MLLAPPRWSRRAALRAARASRRADRQSGGGLDAARGVTCAGLSPSAGGGVPTPVGDAGGGGGGDEDGAAGWAGATRSSSSSRTTHALIPQAGRANPPGRGTRVTP